MKVSELLKELKKLDPELTVVVSPIRSYPTIGSKTVEVPSHSIRYEIKGVSYSRELEGEKREFASIGYEEFDDVIEVETES